MSGRMTVEPRICPPLAKCLLIVTILDLPLPRANISPTLDMFFVDFKDINKKLELRIYRSAQ